MTSLADRVLKLSENDSRPLNEGMDKLFLDNFKKHQVNLEEELDELAITLEAEDDKASAKIVKITENFNKNFREVRELIRKYKSFLKDY